MQEFRGSRWYEADKPESTNPSFDEYTVLAFSEPVAHLSRRINGQPRRGQFTASPAGPVPPARLRARVCDRGDEKKYLTSGHRRARSIHELIRSRTVTVKTGARVMDFGCRAGHVTTWLHSRHPDWDIHGIDADAESIAWAQANLSPFGKFSCSLPIPPTHYWDGYFDFLIALDFFTRPEDESQLAWLEELLRITRASAQLVISVQSSGVDMIERPTARHWPDRTRGSLYRHDGLSTDFIRHTWGRLLRIEQIVPHWLDQDRALIICRK